MIDAIYPQLEEGLVAASSIFDSKSAFESDAVNLASVFKLVFSKYLRRLLAT